MYKSIKGSNLRSMLGKVNIIDVRKNFLYNLGSIPGSRNIPLDFLMSNPEKYLNKNRLMYIQQSILLYRKAIKISLIWHRAIVQCSTPSLSKIY